MLTVDQIISVAFPAVRSELVRIGNRTWTNDLLEGFTLGGGVEFRTLGRVVEHRGTFYPIQEMTTPLVWTIADEQRNTREKDRIHLCKTMLENLVWAHDFGMSSLVKKGIQLIVSKQFHHYLSDCKVIPLHDDDREELLYVRKLMTAYVVLPR